MLMAFYVRQKKINYIVFLITHQCLVTSMESKLKICQKRHLWQHCMSKPNVAFAVISGTICLFLAYTLALAPCYLASSAGLGVVSSRVCLQLRSPHKIFLWVHRGGIILVLWIKVKHVPSGNFVLYWIKNAKFFVSVSVDNR